MTASAQKIVNRPAPAVRPTLPVHVRSTPGMAQASSLKISHPADPAEREAERTAKHIMRMPLGEGAITARSSPHAARFADSIVQRTPAGISRKADGAASASAKVSSEISASKGSGSPMPTSLRRFMEPRFKADFSRVRLHTGEQAAKLSRKVNARAFTVGNQVYFGRGQFRPESSEGKELVAHELTHTIQQGAAIQRSPLVTEVSQPQIQRSAMSKVLDWLADKANNLPGFRMFTLVIGVNPVNMSKVSATPANILRALIELVPGGGLITQALDNHGIIDKVANWFAAQLKTLGMVGQSFKDALSQFLDSLGLSDLAPWNWGDVWSRAKSIFTTPINSLISFASSAATDIVNAIKDAILKPIAAFAKANAPNGYDLLCAVLGKDPISGDKVERTAENLIGPFMKLIGQEEVWENMKKANAIPRAWAWFKGAVSAVTGFVLQIPELFISAFKSLEVIDIILIPKAFAKLVGVFGGFVGKFISWAGNAVWNLLEIIFDSVKPGLMGYIKKTGAALKSILKNPLPFVGNLVKAAKLGFSNFADRFGTHLKNGLIDWLTGSLTGVYIPKALSLPELGKCALSVLGITWAGIRKKLVKALGDKGEKIVGGIEKGAEWAMKGFEIIKKVATGGVAAAWEMIQEKLTELKDSVVNGIIGFVTETIVTKAIPKLIAMFIPGAGFISAIVSIYDTIMVFVQKISKIIQVVVAFIDSIVAIAGGNIASAAKRVENILAGLLSLAISFLAGFAGLGKVTDKIKGVIDKVRDKVDKAIDSAINWVVAKAKAVVGRVFGKKDKIDERSPVQKQADLNKAIAEVKTLQSDPKATDTLIKQRLPGIKAKYKMKSLELVVDSESELEEKMHVVGEINPKGETPSLRIQKDGTVGPLGIVRKMLSWSAQTLKTLLKDPIWNKFKKALRGKYEAANLAIRHKVSISDTIKNTDAAIAPKKPDPAAELLATKGYPVEGKPKTKPKIVAAARDFLQAANNDLSNLFIGDAHINSTIVKERYDAGDTGDANAQEHVDQREDFVETWGFKDEEFVITIQRKSKRLGTSLQTETRKSTGSKDKT